MSLVSNNRRKGHVVKWAATLALSAMLITPGGMGMTSKAFAATTYDSAVLADNPVGYWPISPGVTTDQTGHHMDGTFTGSPVGTTLPNGDAATAFNGVDQYFTVADNDYLEVTRTGILTVEAWMRPDTLQFQKSESSGYVHWMGKGTAGQHSWVARMYSYKNTENRPNRISGYSFNLSGGLGAGSYFQDAVTAGQWIHYTLVINTVNKSSAYTTGYTKLYKNGVLRDQDRLSDYNIIPGNGTAPMRVGTRDFSSFFQGAVGKVAVYDYELTPDQLMAHYNNMTDVVPPTATVAYSTTAPTNQDVIATITPSENVTITNNGGSKSYTFTQNGSYTFNFVDASGNEGSATAVVSNIDRTAPTLKITLDHTVLNPPNHKMVPIHATLTAQDNNPGPLTISLQSITSNEPDVGSGDGNTVSDIQDADLGTADTDFALRAERSGTGNGRVYTITYTVTDAAGNQSTATATVLVDHDSSK
ncbi:LamG-like jellyroll fold domain-containing protein [Paenibacillus cremeus]|uniref:LamG-like jellyroll fold domain-containing protein n=1 Tax=Paenibacillus cremeus TaxID=2163881 RepID=UPI0021BD58BD|nr:LamG-like jellyroll fold domain-containing protein [Paenibacillus cremeus]